MNNEQLMKAAPSIFATEPWNRVSEKYTFIPTIDVLDALRAEGFTPVRAAQSKTRIEGKGDFTKHMIRMRYGDCKSVGDEVPEIVLVNSHDRSSGFQLSAGIFRLVCSNGMVVKSASFGDVSVRHSGSISAEVVSGTFELAHKMPEIMEAVQQFKSLPMTATQQQEFARKAVRLRYKDNEAGNSNAPFPFENLLSTHRREDAESTLWTTFNKVQENMMRGGLRGRGRMTTRAISSVTEELNVNKALWQLTEATAQEMLP